MPNPSASSPDAHENTENPSLAHVLLSALENLRWFLIKSAAAILVGMVICLAGGNFFVQILKSPLERAGEQRFRRHQEIVLEIGTNVIFNGTLPTNVFGAIPLGSNPVVALRLEPIQVGTNLWLGLQPGDAALAATVGRSEMTLKNLSPMGAFNVAIDLAIYGGFALASPFVFIFFGQFLMPYLKEHGQTWRTIIQIALIMSFLFLAGMVFCYFVMMPIALYGSVQYSRWLHFTADVWRAEDYIGFVCKFCLGMGIGFELPVVLLALVKIGLLDHRKLSKFRAYWLVINLIASAAITPDGNPLTMMLMAAPLQVLFELSIWVARHWARKEEQKGRP